VLKINLKSIKNKVKTVHSYHRASRSGLQADLNSITKGIEIRILDKVNLSPRIKS